MRHFRLSITAPQKKVAELVALMVSEGTDLSVEPVVAPAKLTRRSHDRKVPTVRRAFKLSNADEWLSRRTTRMVIDFILSKGGKPFKIGHAGDYLARHEFNRNTASPILSRMKAEGYLKQDQYGGDYTLAKPFPNQEKQS